MRLHPTRQQEPGLGEPIGERPLVARHLRVPGTSDLRRVSLASARERMRELDERDDDVARMHLVVREVAIDDLDPHPAESLAALLARPSLERRVLEVGQDHVHVARR